MFSSEQLPKLLFLDHSIKYIVLDYLSVDEIIELKPFQAIAFGEYDKLHEEYKNPEKWKEKRDLLTELFSDSDRCQTLSVTPYHGLSDENKEILTLAREFCFFSSKFTSLFANSSFTANTILYWYSLGGLKLAERKHYSSKEYSLFDNEFKRGDAQSKLLQTPCGQVAVVRMGRIQKSIIEGTEEAALLLEYCGVSLCARIPCEAMSLFLFVVSRNNAKLALLLLECGVIPNQHFFIGRDFILPEIINAALDKVPHVMRGEVLRKVEFRWSIFTSILNHRDGLSYLARPDHKGEYIIHRAAKRGDVALIELLHKKFQHKFYADTNSYHELPIYVALLHGHKNAARLLAKYMASDPIYSVNHYRNLHGETLIVTAVKHYSFFAAVFLRDECGADINLKDRDGRTLIEKAIAENSRESLSLARALFLFGAAYQGGDENFVEYILSSRKRNYQGEQDFLQLHKLSLAVGRMETFERHVLNYFKKSKDWDLIIYLSQEKLCLVSVFQFVFELAQDEFDKLGATFLKDELKRGNLFQRVQNLLKKFEQLEKYIDKIIKFRNADPLLKKFCCLRLTPAQRQFSEGKSFWWTREICNSWQNKLEWVLVGLKPYQSSLTNVTATIFHDSRAGDFPRPVECDMFNCFR